MAKHQKKIENQNLNTVLSKLRSGNVLTQNEGVEAAIKAGERFVPELILLLNEPEVNRSQVMYALAQIGDKQTRETFMVALRDKNEYVRSYAAVGLARIGDQRSMEACLQTLNDAPDLLHSDRTPSVDALGAMGLKVVPSLLNLLMHEDLMTRLHSQRVLELVIMQRYGFRTGKGFPTKKAEAQAKEALLIHGNYDYEDDKATREASVSKLREWLITLKD